MQITSPKHARREWLAAVLLILVISAASYLLLAGRLGFTSDDWYLVYAGLTGGLTSFINVFASDRPFRAYFAGPVFDLFGLRPQLYLYLGCALRVGGALALYWLLRQVWPRLGWFNVALAALFVVYPGWADQVIPFDVHAHLLGVGLMLLSMALAVRALSVRGAVAKAALIVTAVLCQLISLVMMEYYIGMEGLRFALLALLCLDRRPLDTLRRVRPPTGGWLARWKQMIIAWLPYLFGAGAFMVWRIFLFENTRGATDISAMVSGLAGSPLLRGLWSLVYLAQDFLNVTLLAWFIPLYQQAFNQRLRESLLTIVLGLLMGFIAWLVLGWLKSANDPFAPAENAPDSRATDSGASALRAEALHADGVAMIWTGCLGIIAALVPVALGSRHIVFPAFGRFTLPPSAGAILLIGGLLIVYGRGSIRRWAPALLIALAVMAHYGNAVRFADGWDTIRNFWWQVSWRAPQIAPETVLVADYPNTGILEDYYVWGPANLVYYPERYTVDNVHRTPLAAVLLNPDTVQYIQMNRTLGDRERRGLTSTQDLSRVLMLSMPAVGSCVHLLDGRSPELSSVESYPMALAAPYSRAGLVQVDDPPHTPPAELFGGEPAHGWCYTYQKASLARQRGDWPEVVRLGDEAIHAGLHPNDWVEWMPFVQAYAYLGRYDDANKLLPILNDVAFLKSQACNNFTKDRPAYAKDYPEGQQYLKDKFCN